MCPPRLESLAYVVYALADMDISCAFATSLDTPDQIALAERLGYRRAWCYDSPALYPDVWMALALAAERTSVIGLGPGVLIPHLRHVMTNAAAIATLEALAPGRVAVAIGAGFTGRLAMGQRPLSWRSIRAYIVALRSLLRGEAIEWNGAVMQMLHREGFAAPRPVDVPLIVGVSGPRGLAVAEEVADGVIGSTVGAQVDVSKLKWRLRMINGTVLEDGETPDSQRALDAAGHGAALVLHSAYENNRSETVDGGADYARAVDALPEARRHLAIHEGHLVGLNDLDRRFVDGAFLARYGRALTPSQWRERIAQAEADSATELIYQPAGPDIPRELRAFAAVAGLEHRA